MAIRIDHTAARVLIGTALLLGLTGRATAQCVGDCDGDGEVTVDELILGVNIVLGEQPISACPAFANNEGQVTMAQLILGVHNALYGCPVVPSPTPSETPTVTPTGTPVAGNCMFVSGPTQSRIQIDAAILPNPVSLDLAGSIDVDCTVSEGQSNGECTCTVAAIDPIRLAGVGTVCISPRAEPCPAAVVECEGGAPLGIDLRSDGNVGACTGNDSCRATCETHCAGIGAELSTAGCTGYCSLTNDVTCSVDADCLPDNGACNGPDPVGARFDICQCTCIDSSAGSAAAAGEAQCNLGVTLAVEANPPCDGTDVTIALGSSCVSLTTATASTLITKANFTAGTVPKSGIPLASTGAPVACSVLTEGMVSGLKTRGVVNFFGSALGDLAVLLAADCR